MESRKVINSENDVNKIDEAAKGLKVKNKNVITVQRNNFQCEKKAFCSDDVKKHVSILCKFEFNLLIILSHFFGCLSHLLFFLGR